MEEVCWLICHTPTLLQICFKISNKHQVQTGKGGERGKRVGIRWYKNEANSKCGWKFFTLAYRWVTNLLLLQATQRTALPLPAMGSLHGWLLRRRGVLGLSLDMQGKVRPCWGRCRRGRQVFVRQRLQESSLCAGGRARVSFHRAALLISCVMSSGFISPYKYQFPHHKTGLIMLTA